MADLYILRTSLRDLLRAKRVVASLILILVPAGIALLWRFAARDMFDPYDAYNTLSTVVIYGFLLVILSVVFGTGVISQEIEQKTIVYLLTRPVPRWRIVLMKFAAAFIGIVVTVLASTLLLGAVTVGGGGDPSNVLRMRDLRDRNFLVNTLTAREDAVSQYLYEKLSDRNKERLDDRVERLKWQARQAVRRRMQNRANASGQPGSRRVNAPQPPSPPQPGSATPGPGAAASPEVPNPRWRFDDDYYQERILRGVNETLVADPDFYSEERFPSFYAETPEIQQLIKEQPRSGPKLARLNRLLVERFWGQDIIPRAEPVFPLKRDLLILPVGALAYGALFLLLATLLNRPLMYGLVFAFGWESWAPNLPGNFKMASIMAHLRTLAPHPQPAAEQVDLLQFLSGGQQTVITENLARGVLIGVIVIALSFALIFFSNFEYVPREDAE